MGQDTEKTNTSPGGDENDRREEGATRHSPEAESARDADAAQRSRPDDAWRPTGEPAGQSPDEQIEGEDERGEHAGGDQDVGSAQGGA